MYMIEHISFMKDESRIYLEKIEKSEAQLEEANIRIAVERALKQRRLAHQRDRAKLKAHII